MRILLTLVYQQVQKDWDEVLANCSLHISVNVSSAGLLVNADQHRRMTQIVESLEMSRA
jgi:hypothetical protein